MTVASVSWRRRPSRAGLHCRSHPLRAEKITSNGNNPMVGNAPDIGVSNVAMTFLLSDCFIYGGTYTDPDVSRAGRPDRMGRTRRQSLVAAGASYRVRQFVRSYHHLGRLVHRLRFSSLPHPQTHCSVPVAGLLAAP